MQLVEWLASLENTIVPRVFTNRVCHHQFDAGILAAVDNFGKLGRAPSHPKSLDYLTTHPIDSGGDVKRLFPVCIYSNTYCMSSDYNATAWSVNRDNRLLS